MEFITFIVLIKLQMFQTSCRKRGKSPQSGEVIKIYWWEDKVLLFPWGKTLRIQRWGNNSLLLLFSNCPVTPKKHMYYN